MILANSVACHQTHEAVIREQFRVHKGVLHIRFVHEMLLYS